MNKVFFTLVFLFVVLNIKAQKAEYYPQVAFDSIEAKNMLAKGKGSVEGIALQKLDQVLVIELHWGLRFTPKM